MSEASPSTQGPSGAAGGWRVSLVVGLVALAVHLPALLNGFVLDDHLLIEQNEAIRHPFDVAQVWLQDFWAKRFDSPAYYRPLVTQSFALEHLVAGTSPATYHAVNLLLHAAAAILLHRSARRILPGTYPAALTALLFASHPLASEPVDAIFGRPDLLATLLTLGALLSHLRAGDAGRGAARFLPAAGLYLLALLAKESAAPLPFLLLLIDGMASTGSPRDVARAWRRKAPAYALLGIALALYVALRAYVLGGVVSTDRIRFLHNPLIEAGVGTRLLTAPILLVEYLQLWLFPLKLSPNYSFNQIPVAASAADPRVLIGSLVCAAFVGVGIWLARRRHPAFLGWSFFALFYLLVANLVVPVGALLAERFLYLPMAGLCLMAGAWAGPDLDAAGPGRVARWRLGAALAILLLLGACSFQRASSWRDDETVARAIVAAAPGSAVGYLNLGVAIGSGDGDEARRLEAALELYRRAIEIYPDYTAAFHNAGVTLLEAGRNAEAIPLLERAYELQPSYRRTAFSLGIACFRVGRGDEAVGLLAIAARDEPQDLTIRGDYGAVLESLGRDAEAREQLLAALELAGPHPSVVFNLALVEVKLGRFADALPRLRLLLARDPRDVGALTLEGRALAGIGDTPSALAALRRAVEIDPGFGEAWYRLGLLQRRLGDPEAAESLRHASALGYPPEEPEGPVTPEG